MSVRKLLAGALVFGLAATVFPSPVSAEIGTAGRVDWATTYVASRQNPDGSIPSSFGAAHASTADAVLSLVASGQGGGRVEDAISWLETNVGSVTSLGQRAKVVLAVVAAGYDPRDFGGQDLVAAIEATLGSDAVYDSSEFSQVFDQALALLALDAASAPIPRAPVEWLADAQCPDGGWQFDQPRRAGENRRCRNLNDVNDFTETDTNTTGLVLQALAAVPRSVPLKARPFRWLTFRRDKVKGGWGFDRTFRLTDSLSTSIVLQAYAAYGKKPPRAARVALRGLQRFCDGRKLTGGFARGWERTASGYRRTPGIDLGNTVGAILGLLQKPLPIRPRAHLEPMPKTLPCDAAS